jgi:hypothetical protein
MLADRVRCSMSYRLDAELLGTIVEELVAVAGV